MESQSLAKTLGIVITSFRFFPGLLRFKTHLTTGLSPMTIPVVLELERLSSTGAAASSAGKLS